MSTAAAGPGAAVINLRDRRPIWALPAWATAEIRDALDDRDVIVLDDEVDGRGDGAGMSPAALHAIADAEIYFGAGLPRPLLGAALAAQPQRLRWVHTVTAGAGASLHPELREAGIILTNSAGVYAEPMAESALAMMLHFARGLDHAVRAQARGTWEPAPFQALDPPVRELTGATIGIIGLGGVGRAVAWRAQVLGMRVIAVRRSTAAPPPGVELLTGVSALAELLARSDYVVVAAPATSATRRLIDAAALRRMKRGAVLVNVARGDIVDEDALADALRTGALRGAALDVFATEPLPHASPLWSLPNVLITPHVSGTSTRFWRRQTDLMLDNIRRYRAGERLRNAVSIERGY